MDRAVVLGDVVVDGPGAEGIGHGGVGGPELFVGVTFLEEGGLGGVDAEEVEVGVCEVGLEAEGLGHADRFEEVEHVFPGMHRTPADFTFRAEALTIVGGDDGGLLEGLGNPGGIGGGVFGPVGDTGGGVDADGSVFADAVLVEDLGDAAGFFDGEDELALSFVVTHGGVTDGAGPDGGDKGADFQIVRGDEVGDAPQFVLGGVGVGVGVEEEVVDAVEFLTVDFSGGGEFEHALEADRRLRGSFFFPDEAGPHGVV